MSCTEKGFFGEEFSQPSDRLNGQPNESFIRSARAGDSIHFAPPLTWRQLWRKGRALLSMKSNELAGEHYAIEE